MELLKKNLIESTRLRITDDANNGDEDDYPEIPTSESPNGFAIPCAVTLSLSFLSR